MNDGGTSTGGGEPIVLVVEDDPDLANLYSRWLADRYTVRVATKGTEALELLDEDVSVVLLDRRMPGMSGDEVLSEARALGYDCQVAVVTGVEPDFDIIEMGFDDYLVKPISEEALHETVIRLLERSSYDSQVRQLFALASKKAVLETEKDEMELLGSQEYQQLLDEMEALQADLEETMEGLEDADITVLIRNLETESLASE
ncbi:MAG: HalX domain-containing protein [Halobacteriales archaeon]|nr:HalX domain-containing protein [Halobacteriales archaeon]